MDGDRTGELRHLKEAKFLDAWNIFGYYFCEDFQFGLCKRGLESGPLVRMVQTSQLTALINWADRMVWKVAQQALPNDRNRTGQGFREHLRFQEDEQGESSRHRCMQIEFFLHVSIPIPLTLHCQFWRIGDHGLWSFLEILRKRSKTCVLERGGSKSCMVFSSAMVHLGLGGYCLSTCDLRAHGSR